MDDQQTHALATLDEAVEHSSAGRQQTADLWEALETLAARCVEQDTLNHIWESAGGSNDIGRYQSLNAARNRVLHLVAAQAKQSRMRA